MHPYCLSQNAKEKKNNLEKLENPNLYENLGKDPVSELHKEVFSLWVEGKNEQFITANDASFVMGVSNNPKPDGSGPTNRPSTSLQTR